MTARFVRAPNPGAFTLDGTNTWIVGNLVIDPGPAIPSHLAAILDQVPALQTIAVTHRHGDHAPGALELRRSLPHVRIVAPEGVLEDARDVTLADGMIIDCGDSLQLRAIHTPGHTDEHYCFLSTAGDLFTGDTVLGEGTTTIFPPDGKMGAYLASLERLRALGARRICPGHGPAREDVASWIGWYIEHRHERERQILRVLEGGRHSIPELRRTIYTALDPRLEAAAETQMLAHLIHMRERALVDSTGDEWWLRG